MIIALDGPAGSGKSTVSRELARRLRFLYVDTGAMYRALAWAALRNGASPNDAAALSKLLEGLPLVLKTHPSGRPRFFVGGEEVTEAIRMTEVDRLVSEVARHPSVRSVMVKRQRALAGQGSLVIEGRDIGTVVFPKADFKFYLDAEAKLRAERRWKEMQAKGLSVSLEDVKEEQGRRDHLDQSRAASPLKPAEDALRIDTTGKRVEEVVHQMLGVINRRTAPVNVFYSTVRAFLWFLCKGYFRIRVQGAEHLPAHGGFIIASNHRSFLDPVLLAVTSPRQISFLARDNLFRNPFFGLLIRGLNAHPIRRNAADRTALGLASHLVMNGHVVLMFPEGTRSPDNEFLEPKSGIGFLAEKLGCPVVPAYIEGSYKALPKHQRMIKPVPIRVRFGPPLRFEARSVNQPLVDTYHVISKEVMNSIRRLSEPR